MSKACRVPVKLKRQQPVRIRRRNILSEDDLRDLSEVGGLPDEFVSSEVKYTSGGIYCERKRKVVRRSRRLKRQILPIDIMREYGWKIGHRFSHSMFRRFLPKEEVSGAF